MTQPPVKKIVDGHMTHTRVRRERGAPYEVTVDVGVFKEQLKKITKHHPGRTFVEVMVWEGPEATGEPLAEWELPYQLRYSLDEAARLAVAQTRFPAAEPEPGEPADEEDVTFVAVVEMKDINGEPYLMRYSGHDLAGRTRAIQRKIERGDEDPVWLRVHTSEHGVREPWSSIMPMMFRVPAIKELKIEVVETVIAEEVE